MSRYSVNYYFDGKLGLTMPFCTHQGAMNSARQYVSRGRKGYKATVSKKGITFAWINRPCKLE